MEIWTLILSIIGALAWIPIVVDFFVNLFRRIHCVYLDGNIIWDAVYFEGQKIHDDLLWNKEESGKNGMILLLALNLFVYNKSFFPREIACKVTLQDGASHKAVLYEGGIGMNDNGNRYLYVFPESVNANVNRLIKAECDNIKILPFFVENLNVKSLDKIEKITIEFKGKYFIKKSVVIHQKDCANCNYLGRYEVKQ